MVLSIYSKIKSKIGKGQGVAARFLDKAPSNVQNTLAKALLYPYQYPNLDPFIKSMMAVQLKQGKIGFIGSDAEASRKAFESQMHSIATKPTFVKKVETMQLALTSGNIQARHYHPAPEQMLPLIIFYHGGGFVVGSIDTHDEACRLLAVHANAQVLSVNYPLAPEASPQQLIQCCEEALVWVYKNSAHFKIFNNRIAVAGDSAGGNIATVIAQRTKLEAYAPEAQLLIYPTVDLKSRHPSFFAYKDGLVLTESDIDHVIHFYAEQHSVELDDPLVSPVYGDLKNVAPAYVLSAGHDVLHDEAEIYVHSLQQEGIEVAYVDYEDQTHGFINLTFISTRAKNITIEVAKNFREFWDQHQQI